MGTFNDLATLALERIGRLQAGEVPSASDSQLCLDAANALIDQWKTEDLTLYQRQEVAFNIVASQASYTVGSGANVSMLRPPHIEAVTLVDTAPSPDNEFPLEELSDERWRAIPQKALTASLPSSWYYNPTYPNGLLYLWPIPTGSSLQGKVYAPGAPLDEFAAITTTYSLPPAYRRMLISNLAVEICPDFSREPSAMLLKQAAESMAAVKRANFRPQEQTFQAFVPGGAYNIYSDQ